MWTRRATILPSRSTAISASVMWSRPWASVMNDSRRSAVHFTGRPSCFDAQETVTSSG